MGGRDNARAGGPGAAATSGKAAAAEHTGNREMGQAIAPAAGHLGDLLRAAKRETGFGLGDLTVLSPQNDPFRIDTPTFHVAGRWFADQLERLNLRGKHLRGIHYALLGSTALPNGRPYVNDRLLGVVAGRGGEGRALARLRPVRHDNRPTQRGADCEACLPFDPDPGAPGDPRHRACPTT